MGEFDTDMEEFGKANDIYKMSLGDCPSGVLGCSSMKKEVLGMRARICLVLTHSL